MMPMLFVILFTLAILHFIYEAIIAPTLKDAVGYDMLSLRNRLWLLRVSSVNKEDGAFDVVENSIEGARENLERYTFTRIYFNRRSISEAELATLVDERNRLIDGVGEPELHSIVDLLDKYRFKALLINCGGLLFWLLPIILVYQIQNRFTNVWMERVKKMMMAFVLVPDSGLGDS
jgi:hypothetical protein